jgi:hypothetical protein
VTVRRPLHGSDASTSCFRPAIEARVCDAVRGDSPSRSGRRSSGRRCISRTTSAACTRCLHVGRATGCQPRRCGQCSSSPGRSARLFDESSMVRTECSLVAARDNLGRAANQCFFMWGRSALHWWPHAGQWSTSVLGSLVLMMATASRHRGQTTPVRCGGFVDTLASLSGGRRTQTAEPFEQ